MRIAFASLAALALFGTAAATLVAPGPVALAFGVPADDPNARLYLRGVGSRDAALGALIAVFVRSRNLAALSATMRWTALAGLGDFALIASLRGGKATPNLALHVSGVIGLFVLSRQFDGEGPRRSAG